MLTVRDDVVVSLEYSLRSDEGNLIDSSEGGDPLEFVMGRGQIIVGLEKSLHGMSVGEEKTVVVEPAEGYGEFNSDLMERLPRSAFPTDVELETGMGFRMRGEGGRIMVAYVESFGEDEVVMNMNHPLAGQTLNFDVKIANLRDATDDDLAGGCSSCGSGSGCGSGGCGSSGDDSEGCGGGCGGGCCS